MQRGDESALSIVYSRYANAVYGAARRVLGSRRDAEEVAVDAFMTLWRKARSHQIRLHTESLAPWLITTAGLLARTRLRDIRRHEGKEIPHPDDAFEGLPGASTTGAEPLATALAQLEPLDHELVLLCLNDGLSYKEAARTLGLTHGAVRNRISRARQSLRTVLTAETRGHA